MYVYLLNILIWIIVLYVLYPSKKDKEIRAKELRKHISPHLIKYLCENAGSMMQNSNMALLVKDVITYAEGTLFFSCSIFMSF